MPDGIEYNHGDASTDHVTESRSVIRTGAGMFEHGAWDSVDIIRYPRWVRRTRMTCFR